jgi:DNA polymerase/3'-5' exonuclease PolX
MTDAHPPVALADAIVVANAIVLEGLSCDAFKRAEVAGSTRRKKPQVHDIEVVAAAGDYFGGIPAFLASIGIVRGRPNKAGAKAPWGPKYYKGILTRGRLMGTQLDLFVVTPPADFNVIWLIRTGSADFSHAFVERLHRWGLRCEDGRILRGEVALQTRFEEELFALNHLPYIRPELRDMDLPETRALLEG